MEEVLGLNARPGSGRHCTATASPDADAVTTPTWHVYILDCDRRCYYTGITTDVDRRLAEHRAGRPPGARATRGFKRIEVVYAAAIGPRGTAQRVEHRLKKLTRQEKQRIVAQGPSAAQLMQALGIHGDDGSSRETASVLKS